MGWFYGWESNRQAYIESLNRNHCGGVWRILRQCYRGPRTYGQGSLWTVYERTDGSGERLIGHDLLDYDPKTRAWGHKPGSEADGPCELSCPPAYLKLVPDPGGYATAWRAKVLEWNARTFKALRPHEVWDVADGIRIADDVKALIDWVVVHPGNSSAPRRLRLRANTNSYDMGVGDWVGLSRRLLTHPIRAEHLTGTVRALLAGIEADQGYDRLPVLADALQDANCEAEKALACLRSCAPEARWIGDALIRLAATPAPSRPARKRPARRGDAVAA